MKRCVGAAAMASLCLLLAAAVRAQDSPDSVVRGSKIFRQTELAVGLDNPWEVTWGPDGRLWVTERSGKRVTRIDPATGEKRTAVTIDEVSAPGGQDGLLGLALHPDLLKGSGADFVYVYYTYVDKDRGPDPDVPDEQSPYRYLYGKIVRYSYNAADGALSAPHELIAGLPAGNDHNAGRLKVGPDRKLYLTIGDQGHNQLGNYCLPIEAQRLPTRQEVERKDYAAYVGKSLRLELDGSIPADNPKLAGVRSHVYTYGHRNIQGIDFGPNGLLYAAEHGPKTDDEINVLRKGANYGWPHVAGLRDNKAYEYARWAEASTPCAQIKFNDAAIHPSVPREPESAFKKRFQEPLATLFTVPTGYNFEDPACNGIHYICWPTVGISGVEYYRAQGAGVPDWERALLVTTLKRGSIYVVKLDASGKKAVGPITRHFQSENRYRDTAVSPDGRTLYIATDSGGLAEAIGGGATTNMRNPGAILALTYEGEAEAPIEPKALSKAGDAPTTSSGPGGAGGAPPRFTAAQAASGKVAYNANCAVCHGNTLTNGTMGTPLAGKYFQEKWSGKTVRALLTHAHTMPPSAPDSLAASVYADAVAYILELNGAAAGETPLPADPAAAGEMIIP
ncbi:MAG: quinoprotein glucose dehydrogenase [Acidobacteria bacterium]|nr:quinoprotein glucose dehydrogenase [Acidobacteriota bacterium]